MSKRFVVLEDAKTFFTEQKRFLVGTQSSWASGSNLGHPGDSGAVLLAICVWGVQGQIGCHVFASMFICFITGKFCRVSPNLTIFISARNKEGRSICVAQPLR